MGFSAKQLQALRRPLDGRQIRTREAHGRELSYIEGWFAISEANRIFGFDAWSRETTETRCVLARETRGTFLAVYIAKARITVQVAGAIVIREGHGSGEGRGTSPGDVHDIALKAAETDASKRAFATFGRPFGLELYRQSRTANSPSPPLQPAPPAIEPTRYGFHPDDTTPIPRPSRYYGRRQSPPLNEHYRATAPAIPQTKPTAPPSAAFPLAPPIADSSSARNRTSQDRAKHQGRSSKDRQKHPCAGRTQTAAGQVALAFCGGPTLPRLRTSSL